MVPEISAANIVLLGSFNPSIFQPAWFGNKNLIRTKEADDAKVEIIHPDICSFAVEWFKLNVTQNRFVIETADALHFEPVRDLVWATFKILEHTPVFKMGINRLMHFSLANQEKWHGFGHLMAPKEPWAKVMKKPGLRSMVMEDQRTDPPGFLRVKIEPSIRVVNGVYVEVNNHFEFASKESCLRQLMDILRDLWAGIIKSSDEVAQNLLSLEY